MPVQAAGQPEIIEVHQSEMSSPHPPQSTANCSAYWVDPARGRQCPIPSTDGRTACKVRRRVFEHKYPVISSIAYPEVAHFVCRQCVAHCKACRVRCCCFGCSCWRAWTHRQNFVQRHPVSTWCRERRLPSKGCAGRRSGFGGRRGLLRFHRPRQRRSCRGWRHL